MFASRYLLTCCLLKNEEELAEEVSAWSFRHCFVLWDIGQKRPIYSRVSQRSRCSFLLQGAKTYHLM